MEQKRIPPPSKNSNYCVQYAVSISHFQYNMSKIALKNCQMETRPLSCLSNVNIFCYPCTSVGKFVLWPKLTANGHLGDQLQVYSAAPWLWAITWALNWHACFATVWETRAPGGNVKNAHRASNPGPYNINIMNDYNNILDWDQTATIASVYFYFILFYYVWINRRISKWSKRPISQFLDLTKHQNVMGFLKILH